MSFRVGCIVVKIMIMVVRVNQATWQLLNALFLLRSLQVQIPHDSLICASDWCLATREVRIR